MKIKIQYENKSTYLEVQDEDCTVMINSDYEDRLSNNEEHEMVNRRSAQEIMEERFNKPDYNNWHKFDRHRGMPKKPYRKDYQDPDNTDHMVYIPDNSDEKVRDKREEDEYIREIIYKTLKPKQAELIISIYLDRVPITEYAEKEGVSVSAISHRLETAKKNFKKVFPKSSTFPSC